ncbi:monocarboxylate transporter 9-like [Ptychodera flava]|uniref:monocarboxylate transporter 9-like n=1 Tax=Ptychodera flava TaxID=63121 RepID=UPI00396A0174
MIAHAPDGGWGWIVVIATFIITLLCSGSAYSFGVIYAALLDAFGKSSAATAWVGSIANVVFALATPVGVLLARWLGHRKTVMLGAMLATVGYLSSAFVTQLYQLYFTFGVLVSGGCSLAYISGIEMTSQYFEKKLAIALGFAMAGTGAGWMRDMSGDYKGAFWLAAVSCFLAAVFALILPIVDSIIKRRQRKRRKGSNKQENVDIDDNYAEAELKTTD